MNIISPSSETTPSTIMSNYSTFSNNNCFICFEYNVSGFIPINLRNINSVSRNCQCNGNIHIKCLQRWLRENNNCPVCRTPYSSDVIIINNNYNTIFTVYISMIIVTGFIVFIIYIIKATNLKPIKLQF